MKMKSKIKIVGLTAIAVIASFQALAKPYRVSGDCMEPAIKDGHLYFVNRILPYIRPYQAGDVVFFEHDRKVWVSRIVALETSTIRIDEGSVSVNGVPLQDGIQRSWSNWKHGVHGIGKPIQIPADCLFVLSDNLSAQHDDSRVFGPIPKGAVIGIVW